MAEELNINIEESVQTATDIEELARTVGVGVERQNEILTELKECRAQLQQLLTQIPTSQAESPVLLTLLERSDNLQTQLENLKSSILADMADMKASNRERHESTPNPTPEVIVPVEPEPAVLIVEPERDVPPPPRKRRVNVL